jgi:fluoride exporter
MVALRSYGPLYTAIATGALTSDHRKSRVRCLMYLGFCGSLTTFSGWQLDVFFSWINEGHSHRNGLRDVCLYLCPVFWKLML